MQESASTPNTGNHAHQPDESLALVVPIENIPIGDSRERHSQLGMRETITVWLIGLLCAIVALAFIALFMDDDSTMFEKRYERLKTLLDVIMGPVITLLSSVIGFYFGSQAGRQRDSSSDKSGS
ncbi:hypothetical protein [Pseudoduganella violacea]|uniref:Putative membrane protein n=1 Tax=Pseudoduganella violacea TaxID=1715466 RepID=A0A7W5BG45_9BURK|nr:hypothetical protein [Pseudoduganella violacea]MBB3121635.1 putative membrane protein [Pseudoduganella violacea]